MNSSYLTGYHVIAEALRRRVPKEERRRWRLYLSRRGRRRDELETLARRVGVPVMHVREAVLAEMCGAAQQHRGALLVTGRRARTGDLDRALERMGSKNALILALDGITDPRNFGAILRSADQFATELVLAPSRRSAPLSDAVRVSSAGASEHVEIIRVPNLPGAFRRLREEGFWIYGAHLDGEPLDRVSFPDRCVLVMGSEGRGLGALVARRCDGLVRIPSAGTVESFNVSVAAGILLYEIRRRQGFFDVTDEERSDGRGR